MSREGSSLKRVSLSTRSAMSMASPKGKAKERQRKALREVFLTSRPGCEVCGRRATEVHEIIRRSQAKDAELRPELFLGLCHDCHAFINVNPLFAHSIGFALWSHEDTAEDLVLAAHRRLGFLAERGFPYGQCFEG